MSEDNKLARKALRSSNISTVISISLVLFLIGSLGLLLINAKQLSDYLKENVILTVMLKQDAAETDIQNLKKQLDGNAFIKEVTYISSEQAAEQLRQELGEDFNTFLGFNPLLPLMEIKLKPDYTEENNILQLKDFISKNNIVKEVYFQESLLDAINKNIRNISLIILGFSAVLFFIAGALINNTIRLALYAKRMLIKSMKLVGATRNFIRKPFIVRGILQGLIGAVIANMMILVVFYYAKKQIPEIIAFENPVNLSIVLGIVVFLGIFISAFSTYFAVNKYLRQRTEDIF
ncbi:MAG TPA: permease-like cell division protein FtsX [Bacteroidia bacterium]|jgi:cell division transport system permease protein|nr:permease-like cell division protein FtsX [Bacteroidia bacterium]HMU20516.1 permease-like cell division protein FtsX [Bacteroidia bacterium]